MCLCFYTGDFIFNLSCKSLVPSCFFFFNPISQNLGSCQHPQQLCILLHKYELWLEPFWLPGIKVENPSSVAVSPCSWSLHRSLAHQQAPCPFSKCPAALIHVLSGSCHSSFGTPHICNYLACWVRLLRQLRPEHQSPLQWSSALGRGEQDRTRSGTKRQQAETIFSLWHSAGFSI